MKPKKGTGNSNTATPPVHRTGKKSNSGGPVSGTSRSQGGSRQGNAGHQNTDDQHVHG